LKDQTKAKVNRAKSRPQAIGVSKVGRLPAKTTSLENAKKGFKTPAQSVIADNSDRMWGSNHDQEVSVVQTQGLNGDAITPNPTITFELLRFSERQVGEDDFGKPWLFPAAESCQ